MKEVTQQTFKEEVQDFKGVVLADFYAPWCNPCKMLSPLLEEMSKENTEETVKFVKINVDAEGQLAGTFGVMSIPTVILFKDGKLVDQRIGLAQKSDYATAIKNAQQAKPSDDQEILVFTTPTCPYCHMVKDFLKSKKVNFKEIDVSKDRNWAMKMVQRSGQMGVPQLWMKGQTIVGFDKPRIEMLLQ